jgi:hypothetical protein
LEMVANRGRFLFRLFQVWCYCNLIHIQNMTVFHECEV